jgi:hypothetical protein
VLQERLFGIQDEDVWQALIQEAHGHGQGLEVGRNGDLASFHNLAFEFFGYAAEEDDEGLDL